MIPLHSPSLGNSAKNFIVSLLSSSRTLLIQYFTNTLENNEYYNSFSMFFFLLKKKKQKGKSFISFFLEKHFLEKYILIFLWTLAKRKNEILIFMRIIKNREKI
jgi:hypothetical protein